MNAKLRKKMRNYVMDGQLRADLAGKIDDSIVAEIVHSVIAYRGYWR